MIKKVDKNKDLTKMQVEIINLKKSLINYYFQKSTGQLEKTAVIKKTKKNIAQLKTKMKFNEGKNNA